MNKGKPAAKIVGKRDVSEKVASKYTFRVTWSEPDQEYVGLCAEFPSLSHLDPDLMAAFKGIVELVNDVVKDMQKTGERAPDPIATRRYSGQFKVRIPEALHRNLALQAEEQGVSMNRMISMKLAHG